MKRSNIFPRHSNYDLPTAIKGEGCYIVDDNGKRYIDGSGGAAVSCLGHSDNTVKEATLNGAKIIHNQGLSGYENALSYGFSSVRQSDYDYIITLDADGQHDPKYIQNFIKKNTYDN